MVVNKLALALAVAMGLVQASDRAPECSPTSASDATYHLDGRILRAAPIAAVAPRIGETGIASVYGDRLQGGATASSEPYDRDMLTAAHRTLPLGSRARVTNLKNNKSVIVRINDRGPHTAGRVLDLSRSAAERLGVRTGVVRVRVEVISLPAELTSDVLSRERIDDALDSVDPLGCHILNNSALRVANRLAPRRARLPSPTTADFANPRSGCDASA